MSDKLKPCPFCSGGKECLEVWQKYQTYEFYVVCECGASGPKGGSEQEAKEAWNHRAGEE